MKRPGWDLYFLGIAEAVAVRADCRRRKVGCVIVDDDHRIVHRGTGYNGTTPGKPGCLAGACPRGLLSYEELAGFSSYDTGPGACIGIHAEMNAIANAGSHCRGATLYITCEPCHGCVKLIGAAGIARTVWAAEGRVQSRPGV